MPQKTPSSPKVAIIGAGAVGSTAAYATTIKNVASEVILIDINDSKEEGEVMDIADGLCFVETGCIKGADFKDARDADVIVITAGVPQKEGETRLDLVNKNIKITKSIFKSIGKLKKDTIVIMVANPVDILTRIVQQITKLPKGQVFGSGTSLDTARLRTELGHELKVSPQNIDGYVIGEHGDTEFVCWSNAYVGSKPLMDVIESMTELKLSDLEEIHNDVKNAAYEIIKRKNATYYGIGMTLVSITSAIINNDNRIVPISVYNNGIYDIEKDLYIGLPAVLNSNGVHHVVKIKLNEKENEQLLHSAKVLKDILKQMKF